MERNEFTEAVIGLICDKVADYVGQKVYPEDLAYKLTEEINATGSVNCSAYWAEENIAANSHLYGSLVAFLDSELDTRLNPFKEPERAEVIAYIEAARILIGGSEVYQKWAEENDYKKTEITEEFALALAKDIGRTAKALMIFTGIKRGRKCSGCLLSVFL